MKKAGKFLCLCILGLALTNCSRGNRFTAGERDAFYHPQATTLYSLQPYPNPSRDNSPAAELFHGYEVLGKTSLTPEQSARVTKDINTAAIRWDDDVEKVVAGCFNPRHGLRITDSGHTYDVVICYECAQVERFKDNTVEKPLFLDFGSLPQGPAILNNALKKADIPLSKQ